MKKKKIIIIGDYKYEKLPDGGWMNSSSIACNNSLNDIIKENNLVGKELEVFIKKKK